MGNVQTLFVAHPLPAPGDSIYVPKLEGWSFVVTVDSHGRPLHRVDLGGVLADWGALADAPWLVLHWQCHPCGTGVDRGRIPAPRGEPLTAEEARAFVAAAAAQPTRLA